MTSTEALVRACAARVGVALSERPLGAAWDGESISTNRDRRRRWSNVVHDIAHWYICPPSRRRVVDFGLGPDPETESMVICSRIVSWQEADNEERKASLLGIYIERCLGMEWRDTIDEHNWTMWDGNAVSTLNWLRRFPWVDPSWCPLRSKS